MLSQKLAQCLAIFEFGLATESQEIQQGRDVKTRALGEIAELLSSAPKGLNLQEEHYEQILTVV